MKKQHKAEKLYDGITDIREDIISQAKDMISTNSRKAVNNPWKKWMFAAAAVAAAAVWCIVLLPKRDSSTNVSNVTAYAVAEASYPKAAPFPNEEDYESNGELDYDHYMEALDAWYDDGRKRRALTGYADGLDGFLEKSTKQFLSGAQMQNRIYSPLNVYMALGMLAELTEGDSRQQILDLLGSQDIETLRKQVSDLWNANYRNDGAVTNILASSLWMDQDIGFEQDVMDILANNYYASSYQGQMGSDELNQYFQNWLNEQTGGLLKDQASQVKMAPETILGLAATVYFRARWCEEFSTDDTTEGTFYADGKEVSCEFMNKEKCSMDYYWGDKFTAVSQKIDRYGAMWFLLPDEGVDIDELLEDGQVLEFLLSDEKRAGWKNSKFLKVNLSIPVFDISSRIELQDGLEAMGVTDIFDPSVSDFSAMTKAQGNISLSKADHAARVAVDEEGIAAAAYTVMLMDGGGFMETEEEVDFILNRPFLFVIAESGGLPLFVGAVNEPNI